MDTQKNPKEMSQMIWKTAGRTALILVILLVLILTLFMLLAPLAAGNFLFVIGMKSFASELTLQGAARTGEFDNFYDAFVQSVSGGNFNVTYAATSKLLDFDNCEQKFSELDQQLNAETGGNFSTSKYVKYHYIESGILVGREHNDALWKTAVDINGSYYNLNSPVRGYFQAFVQNPNIELGDLMERLEAIYLRSDVSGYGKFSGWILSRKDDSYGSKQYNGYQNICLDALELIRTRKLSAELETKWQNYARAQGLNI